MHFLFNRLTHIRLELDFSRRGFSVLNCRRPQCIDTCTWWTEGPDPPPPPPPPADLWEVVSRGGLDRGRVAVKYYLLIFIFIPGSICSPVMNITFFFTLVTVNFKLKGSFNLTMLRFPFRVITNIAGFYGKTLFSFILFTVARFSTKIKHFLGEDGYIYTTKRIG